MIKINQKYNKKFLDKEFKNWKTNYTKVSNN